MTDYLPVSMRDCREYQVLSTGLMFHGSLEELFSLQIALNHNCPVILSGNHHDTAHDQQLCAAHSIGFSQRQLDGLLWMRRYCERLVCSEMTREHTWIPRKVDV